LKFNVKTQTDKANIKSQNANPKKLKQWFRSQNHDLRIKTGQEILKSYPQHKLIKIKNEFKFYI
jgi:hypothetical protein